MTQRMRPRLEDEEDDEEEEAAAAAVTGPSQGWKSSVEGRGDQLQTVVCSHLSLSSVSNETLENCGSMSDFSESSVTVPVLVFLLCSSSPPGIPGIPRKVLWEFPYQTSSSWSGGIVCSRNHTQVSNVNILLFLNPCGLFKNILFPELNHGCEN